MKVRSTLLFLLLATFCFAQQQEYRDFRTAFQNVAHARSISINCMHNNEFGTDGCERLPENIGSFYNLRTLHISESGITSLPKSINQLKRLKELYLNYLYYFNYETELCKLQGLDSLEHLGLSMAKIKRLPACICKVKSLKSIDISHIDGLNIESAFHTLLALPGLEALNLSGLKNLSVLPEQVSGMKKLNAIKLDYLKAKFDYTTSFERLGRLPIRSLSLDHNWLNALPASISLLTELEFLDVSNNNFDSLPTQLLGLTKLKEIKIQNNNRSFRDVGAGIERLTCLEKINCGSNWKLDGERTIMHLSKLPKLKDVDFFGCRLDTIPAEIGDFAALEKLNLTNNSEIDFADLFRKLAPVSTLKYLDISDNKLTSLPKEIGLLHSLEYLVMGRNSVSSLPDEFFSLTKLKVVNLYGGHIGAAEIQKIKERLPHCRVIFQWVFRD